MAEHGDIHDPSGDLLPVERCPDCDAQLKPPPHVAHQVEHCGQCGFAYDEHTVWLFCRDIMGASLHGAIVTARAIVGLVITGAIWKLGGAVPGIAFGGLVVIGLVVHIARHASMRRRDGNRPILICPAGVGVWAAAALSIRSWSSLTEVRLQAIHDRRAATEDQSNDDASKTWRLTIRGSLWRPDIGGVFRASRRQAQQLHAAMQARLHAARSTQAGAPSHESAPASRSPEIAES